MCLLALRSSRIEPRSLSLGNESAVSARIRNAITRDPRGTTFLSRLIAQIFARPCNSLPARVSRVPCCAEQRLRPIRRRTKRAKVTKEKKKGTTYRASYLPRWHLLNTQTRLYPPWHDRQLSRRASFRRLRKSVPVRSAKTTRSRREDVPRELPIQFRRDLWTLSRRSRDAFPTAGLRIFPVVSHLRFQRSLLKDTLHRSSFRSIVIQEERRTGRDREKREEREREGESIGTPPNSVQLHLSSLLGHQGQA